MTQADFKGCPYHDHHMVTLGCTCAKPRPGGIISYGDLASANKHRQEIWGQKDAMFAAVELAGEVGEALNVVKKLERERQGMAGSRATLEDLADELGDVAICLDLLAQRYGINLEKAIATKFNKTSRKMGFPVEMVEA